MEIIQIVNRSKYVFSVIHGANYSGGVFH